MIPVLLTKIKTSDGITLDGVIIAPEKRTNTAFIWVHGYTSSFFSGQTRLKELSSRLNTAGIAYLNFNTRGFEIVTGWGKNLHGAAFEKFEHCLRDINAIVSFARKQGYRNIYLAGHSTGANKVVYYQYKTRDPRVKKLLLFGPINDIAGEIKQIGKRVLNKRIVIAKKIARKDPSLLLPQNIEICTAGRYISLYTPGTNEDTFPYYDPRARWKAYSKIRIPIAVIIGSRDEFLDRTPQEFIKIFKEKASHPKSVTGIIIKNAGHSFTKKEKELSSAVVRWLKT